MAKKAFVYDGTNWIDIAQSTADLSAYQTSNRTGLQLIVPTSVTGGTLSANGQITFTGTSSVAVDGCFTSAYNHYKVVFFVDTKATTAALALQVRTSGSTIGGVTYRQQSQRSYGSAIDAIPNSSGTSAFTSPAAIGNGQSAMWSMEFLNPANSSVSTFWNGQWFAYDGGNFVGNSSQGAEFTSANRDGFIISGSGTMTGTIRIYGYNNGL